MNHTVSVGRTDGWMEGSWCSTGKSIPEEGKLVKMDGTSAVVADLQRQESDSDSVGYELVE